MSEDVVDKINARLEVLKEYVEILRSLKGVTGRELKKNLDKRAKAERFLQLAIEACVDIAELVISDQRLPTPKTSKEAIETLGRQGILDKEFAFQFAPAVGLRNILIHDYLKIDYDQVAEKINNRLGDFEKFAQQIAKWYS
ncbi:MAG: type VII toxin-antitoxin system HepT family RNase toxin [Microgenomates group bacterium]